MSAENEAAAEVQSAARGNTTNEANCSTTIRRPARQVAVSPVVDVLEWLLRDRSRRLGG